MEGRQSVGNRSRPGTFPGSSGLARSIDYNETKRTSVMWTRLAIAALCLAGLTAQAQPADDNNMSRLESCIQAARLADAICSKITNDPTQRGDCFAKGRAAQLECLDRVLSEAPGAPAAALSSETARPELPVEAPLP